MDRPQKKSLSKFKETEIISSIFTDRNSIQEESWKIYKYMEIKHLIKHLEIKHKEIKHS